ncbi:MAG: hypothetical protein HY738_03410, partial [Bacteroidia bacterium]|nr:hypothetical protein [Bacteroidia bacterium]
ADLPKDAGEVCKCQSCGVITNSPEYGWVLSEITQADDYITSNPLAAKTANLSEKIAEMVHDHKDFSIQLIEDKASNGYLQIETARVLKEPQIMRRFVTDQAFEKLTNIINSEPQFIYARLYLNDVTLIGVGQKDNLNLLIISVKSSYQRVVAKEKKIEVLDTVVTSKTEVVLMCRAINAGDSKGNIYQHVCSGCGGSVQDTLDIKCPYCGNELNSPKNEWIIADVMSLQQYYEYFGANAAFFYSPVKPEKIDMLYNVRDYAFNNVLIMIAVDGSFADEEIDFAEHLAKKWGYSLDKIQPMIQMAKNNKLVLRMPEDPKMRRKIYALMQKAASVDKNISHQEQSLLDNIKEKYIQ